MHDYEVRIIQDGNVVCSSYSYGDSACQALENAFQSGAVYTPSGNDVFTAFVLNQNGLIFRFELGSAIQL